MAIRAARTLQQMDFMVCANRFDLSGPDLFHDRALKVMTVDRTARIEMAAERLRQTLSGDFSVLVADEAPGYSLLEVAPAGVTKATGLERLADLYGIQRSEIIAFGDNFNDLEMLRFAGMGVAMGNAPDAVKRAARQVTATNDGDGIAVFLEQHIARVA